MFKKIIFLTILIIIGIFSYKYVIPSNFYNNKIINIEEEQEYKFYPEETKGRNFNGESLKIYKVIREKLLPNDENDIKNENNENLTLDESKNIETINEELVMKNKIYLQLGAYRTKDKAQEFVRGFKEKHSKLTNDLYYNIVSANLEERGTYFRIRLGPFNNNREIYSLCIEFKLVNNECLIVRDD